MAPTYESLSQSLRRSINCLVDGDRRLRTEGIITIKKGIATAIIQGQDALPAVSRLYYEDLYKPLMRLLTDSVEKVRTVAVEVMTELANFLNVETIEETSALVVTGICNRIRNGQESSEELRCELISLLRTIIRRAPRSPEIHKLSNDIIDTCGKAVEDRCPDVKKEACELVRVVVNAIPGDKILGCSSARNDLVTALVHITKHQQWKVRHRAVVAITDLMLVKATFKLNRGPDCLISAGPSVPQLLFFAHTEEVINSVTGGTAHDGLVRDRNDKVRAAVGDMLEKILVNGVGIDCENVKAMVVGIAEDTSVETEEELIATLTPDWEKRTLAQLMVMAVSARAFDALHRVAVRKREGLLNITKGFESGACTALRNYLVVPPRPSDLPEGGRFDGIRPMQREEVWKSEESRWYASIFAESLIRFALNGMIEWTASTGIREQTINMCIAVMMMIDIQQTIPFVEELIIHLYKAIRDDDVDAEKRVTHACRILFGVVVNRLGGECFDKIVNTMAQHVGCVLDAKREVAQDGNFWDEEKLGRVTSRVVGAARTMSHYRVTTREGAQDLLLLLGDGIEVHAGHSIRTGVLSTILDIIHTCLTISVDTISGIPRVLKGMLYLEAESRNEEEKGTAGLTDDLVTRIFSLLLQCLASLESWPEVEECISLLALREGTSPAAVYDMYFDVQLSGILSERMHDNWADSDPTRKMLHELLIRSSEESLARCLNDGKKEEGLGGQLMEMLCYQSNPEQCTPSCRVDVIEIIYDIAKRAAENRGPLLDALKAHGIATITEPHNVAIGCVSVTLGLPIASPPVVTLLRGVILPNLIWRPGQANTRIRKATLVALHALFPAVDSCWMRLIAEELLPLVKSCLDDSFTPDNRHLATTVVIDIFEKMLVDGDQHCDEFDAEVLRECYPDMLKRLDDSVDEIRILSCRALEVLMGILASRPGTMKALSNSVFGYIVRALFVHLDDSNMQLSKAVYATLRKASMAGGSAFEAEVDTAAANSLQPDLCLSLLKKEVST